MKKILMIILLHCMFDSVSQDKNSIRIGLRLFREVDAPFSFTRKHQQNKYVFNYGFGVRAKYLRSVSNRISAGLETGAWYFINNSKNVDIYQDEYMTRNIVTPIMCVTHLNVYRNGLNWLSIGLKAGTCYLQNIHKLNDNSVRVSPKWTSIFEISFIAQIVTKRFTVYHFGYGCDFIDRKFIRGLYIDYPAFRF